MARVLTMAAIVIALASCRKPDRPAADPAAKEGAMLKVKSSAFEAASRIPTRFSGEGEDVSPPLEVDGVPAEAKELALICDDPDAPREQPWVHWVVYGVRATVTRFAEGKAPTGALEGTNDFGRTRYGGPLPPRGHGVHHYHFKVYALDAPLGLAAGATKDEVVHAMEGHVLGRGELVGTYERK